MKLKFSLGLTYVLVLWSKGNLYYSKFGDSPYDVIKNAIKELDKDYDVRLRLYHTLEKLFSEYKKL